jgi:hypothetical protein
VGVGRVKTVYRLCSYCGTGEVYAKDHYRCLKCRYKPELCGNDRCTREHTRFGIYCRPCAQSFARLRKQYGEKDMEGAMT